MNNRGKGALGEALAEKYLKDKGYKILSKNCKFAGAELDIVAIHPSKVQKRELKEEYKKVRKDKEALKYILPSLHDILVIVEVKYSSSRIYGEPYERVDFHKQKQIIKATEIFIAKNKFDMPCRFDVISIVGNEINHLQNAFEA